MDPRCRLHYHLICWLVDFYYAPLCSDPHQKSLMLGRHRLPTNTTLPHRETSAAGPSLHIVDHKLCMLRRSQIWGHRDPQHTYTHHVMAGLLGYTAGRDPERMTVLSGACCMDREQLRVSRGLCQKSGEAKSDLKKI